MLANSAEGCSRRTGRRPPAAALRGRPCSPAALRSTGVSRNGAGHKIRSQIKIRTIVRLLTGPAPRTVPRSGAEHFSQRRRGYLESRMGGTNICDAMSLLCSVAIFEIDGPRKPALWGTVPSPSGPSRAQQLTSASRRAASDSEITAAMTCQASAG